MKIGLGVRVLDLRVLKPQSDFICKLGLVWKSEIKAGDISYKIIPPHTLIMSLNNNWSQVTETNLE